MIIKVWLKGAKKYTMIKTPKFKNSFLLQGWLNEQYGMTGWEGFEILQN